MKPINNPTCATIKLYFVAAALSALAGCLFFAAGTHSHSLAYYPIGGMFVAIGSMWLAIGAKYNRNPPRA